VSFKHGYSLEVEFAISVIQYVLGLVHTVDRDMFKINGFIEAKSTV